MLQGPGICTKSAWCNEAIQITTLCVGLFKYGYQVLVLLLLVFAVYIEWFIYSLEKWKWSN